MIILILGPQGSGKGTQAQIIAENLSAFYFDSGAFLREIAKTNPQIDQIVNKRGELIPDDMMLNLVTQKLDGAMDQTVILDGFPRTAYQYQKFSNWLGQIGKKIDLAFLLEIPETETVKRLSARRICDKCGEIYNLITNPPAVADQCKCGGRLTQRPDDTPSAIEERLSWYRTQVTPLVNELVSQGILIKIDGTRSIEQVAADIARNIASTGTNIPNYV